MQLNIKQAVVIAGGKGTRLSDLFPDIPKALVPIGGYPVLEHIIRTYSGQGVTKYIFLISYLASQIKEYFGDGSKWGVSILYHEEANPLGTAGSFSLLSSELNNKPFWVFYGDTVSLIDLKRMESFHIERCSDATVLVHPNDHPYDSDLIEINEDGRIRAIHRKPHKYSYDYRNIVNAALYLFEPIVLNQMPVGLFCDFAKDIFPAWINSLNFFSYSTSEYIKDMGNPDRIFQVESDIAKGKLRKRFLKNKQRAVFLDRDGVINTFKGLVTRPDEIELINGVSQAIKWFNDNDFLVIVVTNQSVIARNLVDETCLDLIHARVEKIISESSGGLIDAIYYCPHHPDNGYPEENAIFKVSCSCRKPRPGMLIRAARKYNIDLSLSYMVGDSVTDVIAGKRAGCKTVYISHTMINNFSFHNFKPDFQFLSLTDFINSIK